MATADEALAEGTRRKVPAAKPAISPLAQEINQQIRRPGGISPAASAVNDQFREVRAQAKPTIVVDSAGRAGVGGIPPTPVQQPAYRTGAPAGQPQFQQTPTPVNPTFRPAPATAGDALGARPAAAPRPVPAAAAEARPLPRSARAAGALAGGLEAINVAQTARESGPAAALDAAKAGGVRLATGQLGATVGGRVGGGIGAVTGGVAGYLAGDALADTELVRGNALVDAFAARRAEANREAGILPGGGGMSMVDTGATMARAQARRDVANRAPLFDPTVQELDAIGALRRPGQPVAAGDALAAPVAAAPATTAAPRPRANFVDETGDAPPSGGGDIVGTFNGRSITREQANDLAGQLNGGTGAGLRDGNPTGVRTTSAGDALATTRPRGPTSRAVGASIGGTSDLSAYAEQLDKQIADLGPLNMRSKRALVGELLGLKGRALGQQAGDASAGERQAQELDARAASDALRADVDREQIAASDRTARRQTTQTITSEDGTIYSVDGNILTPLQDQQGQRVRAPRTASQRENTQAEIAAKLLEGMIPYGATPEQIQQGVQQANQAAAALMAGNTGTPAANAPKGYTQVGTSGGKPVYRDAAGNTFIDE